MRAIICGGRKFEDRVGGFAFLNEIHSGTPISFVIEGGAVGGDRIGREWAIKNNIPYYTYEPDWDGLGPKAGPLRNKVRAAADRSCRRTERSARVCEAGESSSVKHS